MNDRDHEALAHAIQYLDLALTKLYEVEPVPDHKADALLSVRFELVKRLTTE